jgi:hypothetical protein
MSSERSIIMKYLLMLGALLVAPLLAVAPAAAQAPFSATATGTSFTASPGSVIGASVTESASWDGSVSGSPLNGSIHVDETRSHGVEAASGSMSAQFTMTDGGGSSISGSLNGQFWADPNGSSAQGSYTISGGTGAFAGVSGSGSFSQAIGMGGGPSLTLSGVLSGPAYPYAPAGVYAIPQAPVYSPSYAPGAVYQQGPVVSQDSTQTTTVYPAVPGYPGMTVTTRAEDGITVITPNVPNVYRNSPAITGQESRQGCGMPGSGGTSITGQSC